MERGIRNLVAMISGEEHSYFILFFSLMYRLRCLHQVRVPTCGFYGILGPGDKTVFCV